jgi:hypothetical protein
MMTLPTLTRIHHKVFFLQKTVPGTLEKNFFSREAQSLIEIGINKNA